MSKSDDLKGVPGRLNPAAVRIICAREERRALILEGLLPKTTELLAGFPFAGASIERDIRLWTNGKILLGVSEKLTVALENLAASATVEACKIVLEAGEDELAADGWRVRIYAACLGDHDALWNLRQDILSEIAPHEPTSFGHMTKWAIAEGLSRMVSSMEQAYDRGYRRFDKIHLLYSEYIAVARWHADGAHSEKEEQEADRLLRAIEEDQAETAPVTAGGVVVVPELGGGSTSHKRDLQRPWAGIAGQPIPLVARGDVAVARDGLVARWPHAEEIIDIILSDLAASETVRFRPTCLLGRPGSGKTALVKAIAEAVSIPVEINPLGGVSDSSLMGTSAQWSTARESVPLQLIRRSGCANPCVVWDEIEKASSSSHNGSALDALLPMLERTQSRSIKDLALEVEVDLSHVTHFATANSITGIPAPLRDRMRILRMPDPDRRHIGALATNIVDDLMMTRGLDGRWVAPLAPDEIDIIKRAWPGGSLRQLVRIVETVVDGREMLWGRA